MPSRIHSAFGIEGVFHFLHQIVFGVIQTEGRNLPPNFDRRALNDSTMLLTDASNISECWKLRQDDAIPDGVVFIPFAFVEAAANLLTNPALDPFGKIPEFKYCAAKVEKVEDAVREAAE